WYTDGRKNGAESTRVQDLSAEQIAQILSKSPGASADNFQTYTNSGKGTGTAENTDVFLVTRESGQEKTRVDNGVLIHETWEPLNQVLGNQAAGAPDYIFVLGSQDQYPPAGQVPHPENDQTNHIDSVRFNVPGLNVNGNHLAGIIYGDGSALGMPPLTEQMNLEYQLEIVAGIRGSDAPVVNKVEIT